MVPAYISGSSLLASLIALIASLHGDLKSGFVAVTLATAVSMLQPCLVHHLLACPCALADMHGFMESQSSYRCVSHSS